MSNAVEHRLTLAFETMLYRIVERRLVMYVGSDAERRVIKG